MKKIAKKLTAVVVLAMMVVVGSLDGVTVEAAQCQHESCEDRVVYAGAPYRTSHRIFVPVENSNLLQIQTCDITNQEFRVSTVCTNCFTIIKTVTSIKQTHGNRNCSQY